MSEPERSSDSLDAVLTWLAGEPGDDPVSDLALLRSHLVAAGDDSAKSCSISSDCVRLTSVGGFGRVCSRRPFRYRAIFTFLQRHSSIACW